MSDQCLVLALDRLVDRQQGWVVRHEIRAGFRSDRHADILPDLDADRPVLKRPPEPADRAFDKPGIFKATRIECRRPGQGTCAFAGDLERCPELLFELESFIAARRAYHNVE